MNFISSFKNIEELQIYHNSSLKNDFLIEVNTAYLQYAFMQMANSQPCYLTLSLYHSDEIDVIEFQRRITLLMLADDSSVEEYQSLISDPVKYIYIGSKSSFKKTIHSDIIDSLYKKYYNFLKEKEVITQANGSFVLISDYNFKEEDFEYFQSIENTKDSLKAVNNILSHYEELKNDNKFLINKINELNIAISILNNENQNLLENLNNKTLTTWY